MSHEYLKRGKGKKTGDIKKYDFYSHYRKKAKNKKLDRKQYSAFLKSLLIQLSENIVKQNLEVKLGNLGSIRIQAVKGQFFDKNGNKRKKLQVDWKKTWEYWESKFPNKTRDDIILIKNKTVIYHENEHTQGEFYRHIWDKLTSNVKHQKFYEFTPSRQYSRMITKIVTDPNRNIFYFG